MRLRFVWFLSAALCCAGAAPAVAQPSAADLQAAKKAAAELANDAYDDFHAGRFADAIVGFEKADKKFHAPRFLVYVARAQVKLGKLSAAKGTYERVVNERLPQYAPPEFFTAQAEARKELEELLPRLPPPVEPTAEPDPSPAVTASASALPAPTAETAAPTASAAPGSGPPVVTAVAFGVAGLGVAMTAVFGGLTLQKRDEYTQHPTKDALAVGETFSYVTDAALATAVVGAVVGAVVWIVSGRREEPKSSTTRGFVGLRVRGLTVTGSF